MTAMYETELSPEIVLSVHRILEQQKASQDNEIAGIPDNFNPADTLNAYFPDEPSLANVESVQARLSENQKRLQEEIDALHAELRTNQDPSRMYYIQEMISELLGQMSRIREKATESEAVVRNITKDIQVLDLAKKNLIVSMTTLKRLQMLVNAMSQLEELVSERKYHEISQTLSAIKQISSTFKPYTTIKRISQLLKRMQELQGELRGMIDADFDTYYMQDPSKPIKGSVIGDACSVVDILGDDFRAHIIDRYVGLELKEYRRIFRATDEAGQLDNLSRRFAWFRRLLQTHDVEQGRVFPAEWKVGWHLLSKFSEITRDDLTTLLSKAGASLTVKVLLDNLQMTTEFETSVARKLGATFQDILIATASATSRPPLPISAAFESHMGVFVDAQDKAISDMLSPHRKAKRTPRPSLEVPNEIDAVPTAVLPSSTELFYFYAQNLEQCAKLSTGQALFDLCNVHKKWLRIYAEDVLLAGLKRPSPQGRRSVDSRLDETELRQTCLLINTADYCHTTASELEDKIRQNISDTFKAKVTLQVEQDLFLSVISSCIVVQLRELESACDGCFTTLSRISWSSLNQVSGPSPYTGDLVKATDQCVELVKPLVEKKKYLRNLFDKACSLILAKFTHAVVRSRPLKEIGAEQLLIDLQTIKACLLKLPGEDLVTPSYTRSLTKTTGHLEALLKVIVTPVDPPDGFILNYTLLIGDASFSNFQKILDLKGTPKAEQNNLLDSFVTVTSTKDELESTSFLTSLDMDPPATSQIAAEIAGVGGSRVTLPHVVEAAMNAANIGGERVFAGLVTPPMSGPSTGANTPDSSRGGEQKQQVFSDFRRFVSFGRRKDTGGPS